MRFMGCLLAALLCGFTAAGQTYYYEQTRVVVGGRASAGDGSGQFVTFTPQGCYDSDRQGFDAHNGFLRLLKSTGAIRAYYGTSYWGKAYYYVASDFSRINVKVGESGRILVYERRVPADGVTASSLVREPSGGGTLCVPLPAGIAVGNSSEASGGPAGRMVRETCTRCKGSGRSPSRTYPPDYTGGTHVTVSYCAICGCYDKVHSHGTCEGCLGRGYNERYVSGR